MQFALKRRLSGWFDRGHEPDGGSVVLSQRRIFILPTRYGILFGLSLLLMLSGAINYNLSLGFVLTFLLGAMAVNSMLYTFRNLARLRVSTGRATPVFAGGGAEFSVLLENPGTVTRYAIGIMRGKAAPSYSDVPAQGVVAAPLRVPAPRRGILHAGRCTIVTRFPLGLFRAWSYVDLDMHCIVYPKPEPAPVPLPPPRAETGEGSAAGQGNEDFSGLRPYHPGDSPRHVAWKVDARGQGLQTKQFSGRSEARLTLDWDDLPAAMGTEDRLSRLARWVLDADALGLSFGLRLPGLDLPPASGAGQRDRCLEALALHPSSKA